MKKCQICGRGPQKANIRTHSNKAIHKRQYLNLQFATVKDKRLVVCTKCKKTLLKERY